MSKIFKQKICVVCSSVFTPTSSKQKVCENIDCKIAYEKEYNKSRYRLKSIFYDKKCPICGDVFSTSNNRRVVCSSNECRTRYLRTKVAEIRKEAKSVFDKDISFNDVLPFYDRLGYKPDGSGFINASSKLRCTCSSGHSFRLSYSGLINGHRCLKCSDARRKTIEEVKKEFLSHNIEILQDHYKNNSTKIQCKCSKNHLFSISRANFLSGRGCPYCWDTNRKIGFDRVKEEFEKEGFTLLQDYYELSEKPIKCRCPVGHETELSWHKFKIGRRCKVCSNESKRWDISDIKEIFSREGYTITQDFYNNLQNPVDCVCPKGHVIKIRPSGFIHNNHRCGECAVESARKPLSFVKEYLDKFGYTLNQDFYNNEQEPVKCVCPNGHEIQIRFGGFLHAGKRCGKCHPVRSKPEVEVCSFVESLGLEVVPNDRQVIKPKELDVYVPSKKVAIEYCGFYWHGEKNGEKPRSYHYDKMISCAKEGIRLITVFEDEWRDRQEVVKSRILNALGMSERRVYARKCYVSEISLAVANDFLSKYHLQGKGNSSKRWGLFLEDELLQVITVGSLSRAHTGRGGKFLELKRFASLPNVSVVGGASKLFSVVKKYAAENGYTHIKSYCDMRYANYIKPVYEDLGFSLVTYTKYTPHYVKEGIRFRNQGLRKTESERFSGKTEWELREEQGFDRMWDCGHRTYVMEIH